MIREARQQKVLYSVNLLFQPVSLLFQPVRLLFQPSEVRLGDAGLRLDEILNVSDPTREIGNTRIVVQNAHSNDEQRSQECQQRNVDGV